MKKKAFATTQLRCCGAGGSLMFQPRDRVEVFCARSGAWCAGTVLQLISRGGSALRVNSATLCTVLRDDLEVADVQLPAAPSALRKLPPPQQRAAAPKRVRQRAPRSACRAAEGARGARGRALRCSAQLCAALLCCKARQPPALRCALLSAASRRAAWYSPQRMSASAMTRASARRGAARRDRRGEGRCMRARAHVG